MSTRSIVIVPFAAAAALLATVALAQTSTDEARFADLDRDGSGTLSLEEYAAGMRERFDAIDVDHNGQVTVEEMETFEPQRDGQLSAAQRIALDDANQDAELALDEHTAVVEAMFERTDDNGDGSLDLAEFRSDAPVAVPQP
jgi:Ca2+-binding EF-hand superfamily protein